mmetsp:Transcript_47486/g.143722  ORF Transcript_47486/g.143722 Transcript_47486/m.143722 type:complete len:201 (+) Transcript_47486:2006-2608(+)
MLGATRRHPPGIRPDLQVAHPVGLRRRVCSGGALQAQLRDQVRRSQCREEAQPVHLPLHGAQERQGRGRPAHRHCRCEALCWDGARVRGCVGWRCRVPPAIVEGRPRGRPVVGGRRRPQSAGAEGRLQVGYNGWSRERRRHRGTQYPRHDAAERGDIRVPGRAHGGGAHASGVSGSGVDERHPSCGAPASSLARARTRWR